MYTVKQVAERLGISSHSVYMLLAAGQLSHYRLGATGTKRGLIRFSEAHIAEFLANRSTESMNRAPVKPVPILRPKLKHLDLS